MTYRGRVKNGMIVLERPGILPEGTEVEVSPTNGAPDGRPWAEVFEGFTGKAVGLPPDMARNHDHYLHGAPKK